jgi:uncharacterized membrane protein
MRPNEILMNFGTDLPIKYQVHIKIIYRFSGLLQYLNFFHSLRFLINEFSVTSFIHGVLTFFSIDLLTGILSLYVLDILEIYTIKNKIQRKYPMHNG